MQGALRSVLVWLVMGLGTLTVARPPATHPNAPRLAQMLMAALAMIFWPVTYVKWCSSAYFAGAHQYVLASVCYAAGVVLSIFCLPLAVTMVFMTVLLIHLGYFLYGSYMADEAVPPNARRWPFVAVVTGCSILATWASTPTTWMTPPGRTLIWAICWVIMITYFALLRGCYPAAPANSVQPVR